MKEGGEPQPADVEIDQGKLAELVQSLLAESAQYDVECLDLAPAIVQVVNEWFRANHDELEKNFQEFYPLTYPPERDLTNRIRAIFSVERIHATGGGPEFRRTKIIGHWVAEIYYRMLELIFKPERFQDEASE